MQILARRQPVASDLRFITMALKLVTDLERIGDLGRQHLRARRRAQRRAAAQALRRHAQHGARRSRRCCTRRSTPSSPATPIAPSAVIERDRNVDAYYAQIFRELLTYMMEDPRNIYRATRLQSIAKYLERIGDHATNLAEMVVFMVKGKDIRHGGRQVI